ncbi:MULTISPECIES: DUF4145 domain-containing protein [unclassified Micromonospora]|uniref:DUF4145 domain-containing protein n=1 Tax=unclassified Micromonospora TaxID=2617518 RepID=UPI001183B83D|nr:MULTISPECIES: DUF4145 domain-containing protein [unclassified Micromonospora]MDI5939410.1 DUF4145 domain-containing protein [Micromonospora sp. DH15]
MDHPLLPLTAWFFELPHIVCPACSRGHLEKTTAFVRQRSGESLRAEDKWPDDFEPEWVQGMFTGILTCSLTGCWERVAVTGDFETVSKPKPPRVDAWTQEHEMYTERYRLRFAHPAPLIVDCPTSTPEAVRKATTAAAAVIWTDPAGAAGRLRVAVEELMTAQKIAKTRLEKTKAGGRRRAPRKAHERITEFAQNKPDVARVLLAVKWIGNSGSHESRLSAQDVLEGAQMFTHALRLLYDPSQTDLMRRVALVNKRRGPVPRKAIVTTGP